jgi:hypothetical protein
MRWIVRRQRTDLILCGLFTVFAANTKNEGLGLAVILALTIIVLAATAPQSRHKVWMDVAIFLAIGLLGVGVWISWRSGIPHTDENYPARLSWSVLSANANRLGTILSMMASSMANVALWGLLWILLPAIAALGYRALAQTPARVLWALFLLHLTLYTTIYVITAWDVQLLLRDSLDRLLMHIAPTAALLIAVHWAAVFARQEERRGLPAASVQRG